MFPCVLLQDPIQRLFPCALRQDPIQRLSQSLLQSKSFTADSEGNSGVGVNNRSGGGEGEGGGGGKSSSRLLASRLLNTVAGSDPNGSSAAALLSGALSGAHLSPSGVYVDADGTPLGAPLDPKKRVSSGSGGGGWTDGPVFDTQPGRASGGAESPSKRGSKRDLTPSKLLFGPVYYQVTSRACDRRVF